MPNITEIAPLNFLIGFTPVQSCVSFTHPCINPFVPTSITREYHPKVLERLHCLLCIFAHVQNALPCAFWETNYLNFLCWFSFLLGCTQLKIDQMRAEDPVEKIHARNTNSSAKADDSSCSSQQWHPCRRVDDWLSNSYRPGISTTFWDWTT